jgi:hypothetical protein
MTKQVNQGKDQGGTTQQKERKSSHFFIGVEDIGLRFLVFLYL